MSSPKKINVSVVYALAQEPIIIDLQVAEGSTLLQAVELSGMAQKVPDLDLSSAAIGIFGCRITNKDSYQLKPNDQIEIYRPLIRSPEEIRQARIKSP